MSEPINMYVEFLSSYGPSPSSSNLYDEFVVDAAKKTGCAPLKVEQPLVDQILDNLKGVTSKSVILTGTAGDGKTYTARQVLGRLTGRDEIWGNTEKQYHISDGGREYVFVKDLSELNEKDKDEFFPGLIDSLSNPESNRKYIVCVNDGHLLKLFREREEPINGVQPLHEELREMLRLDQRLDHDQRFLLFNMSRLPHDEIVDQIFDQIVGDPAWEGCYGCSIDSEANDLCPIRINLDLLKSTDQSSFREKLKYLIRMASANGRHLSIRQIILLTVNILLGDSKPQSQLLTCTKARSRAKNNDYVYTNPFNNAFGDNLPNGMKRQYQAFSVLEEFGIGKETNNFFDDAILNKHSDIPKHPVYGDRIFESLRQRYQREPKNSGSEVIDGLISQRRRVFFSSQRVGTNPQFNSVWNLSVYRYGKEYVEFIDALEAEDFGTPERRVTDLLILGLNRIMTGSMTNTYDSLWLCKPSGVYQGREMPFLIQNIARKRLNMGAVLSFQKPKNRGLPPSMQISLMQISNNPIQVCELNISPNIFEFLIRVANGMLPMSFSNHCFQEVKKFQLAAAERFETLLGTLDLQEVVTDGASLQAQPVILMGGE